MTDAAAPTRVILLVSAPDRPGLVADTTAYVRDVGGNIEEAEQHSTSGGVFVQRMQIAVPATTDLEGLRSGVAAITAGEVTCHAVGTRTRVALFVSRAGHAAYDVMSRVALGSLPIEVVCIVSDHPDHADLARRFDVPFLGIPVEGRSREEHEAEVLRSITPFGVELIAVAMAMLVGIAGASSVLANTPVVAASILLIKGYLVIAELVPEHALGPTFTAWPSATIPLFVAMMFGATLGGNSTLIGAAANVVSAGICANHGKRVTFMQFLRYGVPITVCQLAFAAGYVLVLDRVMS